jgi:hypothetical protein
VLHLHFHGLALSQLHSAKCPLLIARHNLRRERPFQSRQFRAALVAPAKHLAAKLPAPSQMAAYPTKDARDLSSRKPTAVALSATYGSSQSSYRLAASNVETTDIADLPPPEYPLLGLGPCASHEEPVHGPKRLVNSAMRFAGALWHTLVSTWEPAVYPLLFLVVVSCCCHDSVWIRCAFGDCVEASVQGERLCVVGG